MQINKTRTWCNGGLRWNFVIVLVSRIYGFLPAKINFKEVIFFWTNYKTGGHLYRFARRKENFGLPASTVQNWLPCMRVQVQILATAFFFNFPLFHDPLNRPTVHPVFPIEPQFIWFSHNSLIPGFLGLKNWISVQFPVFLVGPSDPVQVSKPWIKLFQKAKN